MKKGQLSNALRKFKLIYTTDWIRFYIERFKNNKDNAAFSKQHPEVKLPPDYLMYESFQINYRKYFSNSGKDATQIAGRLAKYIDLKDKKILDWGCGPGRIIRKMPEIIGKSCEFYGTDYNEKSIKWCSANLPGIHFSNNTIEAKLPYENGFFDVIYGISIFTHLSEVSHYKWYDELFRILKPGGIIYLTTQGDNFKIKLTDAELQQYNNGEIIERGNVKEGHRTFSAFHPPVFMKRFFAKAEILEHIETASIGSWMPQDVWIIRKQIDTPV